MENKNLKRTKRIWLLGQSGRTLLELLAILALMVLISTFILYGYQKTQQDYRAKNIVDNASLQATSVMMGISQGKRVKPSETPPIKTPSGYKISVADKNGGDEVIYLSSQYFSITISRDRKEMSQDIAKRVFTQLKSKGAPVWAFGLKRNGTTTYITNENDLNATTLPTDDLILIYSVQLAPRSTNLLLSELPQDNNEESDDSNNACANFTATSCTTACTSTGGVASYTYADNTTSCGTNKVCDGNGDCVCTSGYKEENGDCVVDACANFTVSTCTTACTSTNGVATYTYANSTTSCGTNKVCDGNGDCVCTSGYKEENGDCVVNACANFTASTCTTACTSSGGVASYTYEDDTTSCGIDKVCDGKGGCVCKAGYKEEGGICVVDACAGFEKTTCITACTSSGGVASYTYSSNKTFCCRSNSDCSSGQFCNIQKHGPTCMEPEPGVCTELGTVHSITTYAGWRAYSDYYLTWWAAQNWCEAQGLVLIDVEDLLCYHPCESNYTCRLDRVFHPVRTGHEGGACMKAYYYKTRWTPTYSNRQISKSSDRQAFSQTMIHLYENSATRNRQFWTNSPGYGSCYVLYIIPDTGYIGENDPNDRKSAFCVIHSLDGSSLRKDLDSQYPLQLYYPYNSENYQTSYCLQQAENSCQ